MDAIVESLRNAAHTRLVSTPYDRITIASICTEAKVSRAAFYMRYANKDALFESTIIEDICGPISSLRSAIDTSRFPEQIHLLVDETQCINILKNAEFYKRIVREQPLLFEKALIEGYAAINKSVLQDYRISQVELDYRAHFFAANHVALLKHWIISDFNVEPRTLANWYYDWSTVCWSQSLPR